MMRQASDHIARVGAPPRVFGRTAYARRMGMAIANAFDEVSAGHVPFSQMRGRDWCGKRADSNVWRLASTSWLFFLVSHIVVLDFRVF